MKTNLLGIDRNSSTVEAKEGMSDYMVNLRIKGGALNPVGEWNEVLRWDTVDVKPLYIHSNAGWDNLIGHSTKTKFLYLISRKTEYWEPTRVPIYRLKEVNSISSLGNTLIVCDSKQTHYILWKDGAYKYLGNKPPMLDIRFSTKPTKWEEYTDKVRGSFEIKVASTDATFTADDCIFIEHKDFQAPKGAVKQGSFIIDSGDIDANRNTYSRELLALHNSLSDAIYDNGDICQPMLLRAGIRLFDGSYINCTPMVYPYNGIPNYGKYKPYNADGNGYQDLWYFTRGVREDADGDRKTALLRMRGKQLYYQLVNKKEDYDDWSDIISSIDIFISKPLPTIDSEVQVKEFMCNKISLGYSIYFSNDRTVQAGYKEEDSYIPLPTDIGGKGSLWNVLKIPFVEKPEIQKGVSEAGNFYRIKEIVINEISNEETRLKDEISKSYKILEQKEELTNECYNDTITADMLYNYNSRIHYSGIHSTLSHAYDLRMSMVNGRNEIRAYAIEVTVKAEKTIKTLIKKGYSNTEAYNVALSPMFIFPDERAIEATIHILKGDNNIFAPIVKTITLKAHNSLNCSYYLNSLEQEDFNTWAPDNVMAVGEANTVSNYLNHFTETADYNEYNKKELRISPVDNPFVTIPSETMEFDGIIQGLCTSTNALSSGEFGQSPMYVFTDSGIWALEVGSTVSYKNKIPISRDISIGNLCPIDNAIVFSSLKGIMLIQGRTVKCISDALDGECPQCQYELTKDMSLAVDSKHFREQIIVSTIEYNYKYNEIYVIPEHNHYAYVYDMSTGMWGIRILEEKISHIKKRTTYKHHIGMLRNYPTLYSCSEVYDKEYTHPITKEMTETNTSNPIAYFDPNSFISIEANSYYPRLFYQGYTIKLFTNDYTLPYRLEASTNVRVKFKVKIIGWNFTGGFAQCKPANWLMPKLIILNKDKSVKSHYDFTSVDRSEEKFNNPKFGLIGYGWNTIEKQLDLLQGECIVVAQSNSGDEVLNKKTWSSYGAITFNSIEDVTINPDNPDGPPIIPEPDNKPDPINPPIETVTAGIYNAMYDCSKENEAKEILWISRVTAFGEEVDKKITSAILRCLLIGDGDSNFLMELRIGNNVQALSKAVASKVLPKGVSLQLKDIHCGRLPMSRRYYQLMVTGKLDKHSELNSIEWVMMKGLDTAKR